MPETIIAAVTYGGYISAVKIIVHLGLFLLWIPLVTWVHNDAKMVDTNEAAWTATVLGTGAAALLIWQFIPIFLIGLALYVLAVGTAALAYVRHRNARVMDFDRVLTVEHIKSLLSRSDDKLAAMKSFTFITANHNEVPLPEPRTPDFFGYRMAYELFSDAEWRRAESIIFTPTAEDYKVTYYVDGVAAKQPSIEKEHIKFIIHFLKNIADLDLKEKRKPQKGSFALSKDRVVTEWEVTTAGSTVGEQVLIKRTTAEDIARVDQIGFMPDQLEQVKALRSLKQGLFIVSGPAKSGVTTTFYALLRNHDAFINSINTLETRPTAEVPNITQNVFNPAEAGTSTYAEKLAQMIRMGPDIVGITDCKDTESAQLACKAAADGKIVYIVLEADSVIQALGRWLKLAKDRNLVADTLVGISNQRLLRKLCNECKQAYAPNKGVFKKFNINAEKTKVLYRAGKVIYDKHGKPSDCEDCQAIGYVGRTGVFETVFLNDQLREVVRNAKSLPEISSNFRRARMLYLQEQALRKVIAGVTDINEMIRAISATKQKTRPSK